MQYSKVADLANDPPIPVIFQEPVRRVPVEITESSLDQGFERLK